MALLGEESGDVIFGEGVTVGLLAGEAVLPAVCVPRTSTVAVPVTETGVACTGGCKIVQTKRLEESAINIPSTASNGISLLFANTRCCGTGSCGTSDGFCSGGLLIWCVNAGLNSPLFTYIRLSCLISSVFLAGMSGEGL